MLVVVLVVGATGVQCSSKEDKERRRKERQRGEDVDVDRLRPEQASRHDMKEWTITNDRMELSVRKSSQSFRSVRSGVVWCGLVWTSLVCRLRRAGTALGGAQDRTGLEEV